MQETFKTVAQHLLDAHFHLTIDLLPPLNKSVKSEWQRVNKYGFLSGVVQFGMAFHVDQVSRILQSGEDKDEIDFQLDKLIDSLFDFYIMPFRWQYGQSVPMSPVTASTTNIYDTASTGQVLSEPNYSSFKAELKLRDMVCLFCWRGSTCGAAPIVSGTAEPQTLQRVALSSKYQVQNGLWLCLRCHSLFNNLLFFVETGLKDHNGAQRYIFRAIKNIEGCEIDWQKSVGEVSALRIAAESYFADIDGRKAVSADGELDLYFMISDVSLRPSCTALEQHKVACFMWRMCGGKWSRELADDTVPDHQNQSDEFDNMHICL